MTESFYEKHVSKEFVENFRDSPGLTVKLYTLGHQENSVKAGLVENLLEEAGEETHMKAESLSSSSEYDGTIPATQVVDLMPEECYDIEFKWDEGLRVKVESQETSFMTSNYIELYSNEKVGKDQDLPITAKEVKNLLREPDYIIINHQEP